MYDALLEHSLSADIISNDLKGDEILFAQTKPVDSKCKRVVKLYFDVSQKENPTIYFETEAIFENAHNKYLYFGNPRGNGASKYLTTEKLETILESQAINKKLEKSDNPKNPIVQNKNSFCTVKNIFGLFYSEKSESLFIDSVFIDLNNKNTPLRIGDFIKRYEKNSLFVLGVYAKLKYLIFSSSKKYREMLLKQISPQDTANKKDINLFGICDFCKQHKILKKEFAGQGINSIKNIKTFTTTKQSVCYQLNNKDIRRNIRCCESCFNLISQIDKKLDAFRIGVLQEKALNATKTGRFPVYATIQNPTNSDLNFSQIQKRLGTIFGGNKDAFDAIQDECGSNPVFDKKIIFNIYIADYDGKSHSTILNIRNINPRLFEKYFQIIEFIMELNNYFTYRNWKGNFSDMFKTLSMADYRVGLDVFTAILNNFPIDGKKIAELYGHLLRKRFLNADDKSKQEIKYLPIDIFSILLFEQLRQKEEILEFDKELFLAREEIKDDKDTVVEIKYKPKNTAELKRSLGTDWSEAEMAVIDLGRLVSSIVNDIKKAKSTDIEKVFLSKIDFVEMGFDDVRAYCGFLQSKMGEYTKAIKYLDFKRNELGEIQLTLEKNKNQAVSPKAIGYFLSLGYNINGLLRGKANKEGELETTNLKNKGDTDGK